MRDGSRLRVQNYVMALAAVGGAALVRLGLDHLHLAPGRPYIVFAMAVIIGALFGGMRTGIFATLASTLVVEVVFLVPAHQSLIHTRANLVPMLLFLVEGSVIAWLAGAKAQALLELRKVNENLEMRVEQRTEQLRSANQELEERAAEMVRIHRELELHSEQLARSNRELEDFASVASHDLQEPLRKIQAFGDRLRVKAGDRLGEDGSDYLARMLNAAGRMQRLINDLLTFSRVSTRALPFEAVDLAQVARDVVVDLEARMESSGGMVELGELPTIEADPTQMRQIFQNLIGNALKFHREGVAPVVRVEGHRSDGPAANGTGAWEITIKDNGIGFDEKYLDRIFNIFQRLHGRGTYEGTGIGLAVCRKIVERHGGTITARSRPDEGSTFIVCLPEHQPRLMEDHERAQAHNNPAGG